MKNMKIYSRLILAFVIVIALTLIMGAVGMVMISMVSNLASELFDEHVVGLEIAIHLQADITTMRVCLNRMAFYALDGNIQGLNDFRQRYGAAVDDLRENSARFGDLSLSSSEKAVHDRFNQIISAYAASRRTFEAALDASIGNGPAISAALDTMASEASLLENWMDDLVVAKEAQAKAADQQSDALTTLSMIVQAVMIIVVAGFSVFIAIFIATGVENSLRTIIEKLHHSTANISSSATQLSDASESLATGSSRQAAAIEETSATMNETASMIQQNAENTRVASQIAGDTTREANEAGKYMNQLMSHMSELKESSDKVSKIVKTIDDIAFQTNLLAINATVEAARAGGDAGRSFAVVAQEVRSLAQKSASASSETSEIIEKNIMLTDTSRTAAEKVLSIAQQNVQYTTDLSKLISEINAASEEQSSGIKQINIAVSQMEKVTQENAAVAEENAASSNSMKDEIANLEAAVGIAKNLIRNS